MRCPARLDYQPLDPATLAEPSVAWSALALETPVCYLPGLDCYAVAGRALVREVAAHPERFGSPDPGGAGEVPPVLRSRIAEYPHLPPSLITGYGNTHAQLRHHVTRLLGSIERYEPLIAEIAQDLLGAQPDRQEFDLVAAYARPLPVRAIAQLMGIEDVDAARIVDWTRALVDVGNPQLDGGFRMDAAQRLADMAEFLRERIAQRRRDPGGDLLSGLAAIQDPRRAGEWAIDDRTLLSAAAQLITAGNETTCNQLANTVRALLRDEQWGDLVDDASLIPRAVEEGLRIAGAISGTFREAVVDAEVGGVTIPRGARIWVLFASAGHDQQHVSEPGRFRLDRRRHSRSHLAFGHGAHRCIGARLARLELTVALETLVNAAPGLRLADPDSPLDWHASLFIHGPVSLPVRRG